MTADKYTSLYLPTTIILGILCQWISWRFKFPAILPLLLTGLLIGPVLGIMHPGEYLGDLLFDFISFSIAIILFEGAMTLKFKEIKNTLGPVSNLITVGATLTVIVTAILTHYVMDLSWQMSLLFGALIVVTGPTVITPLLRNTRANAKVSSILKWESILIDPIGAILAVLIFNIIVSSASQGADIGFNQVIANFLFMVSTSSFLGAVAGFLVYWIIKNHLLPDYLRDIAILGFMLVTFSAANMLSDDSGLLAVTVMGMILANVKLKQLAEVWHFKEKISTLLLSILFILLASNISVENIMMLDYRAVIVVSVIMFVVRPLAIFTSMAFQKNSHHAISFKEKLFLSWIAPRGIVAAAISSLFSIQLYEFGYEEALYLAPLTFMVIVATVLIQGLTAKPWAVFLGVSELEPQGFMILSANKFSRMLASTLQKEGFIVKLVDNNWTNVRAARLLNLDVHYGNILSEEVEAEADLSGIGRLLTLTSNHEANMLACVDYKNQFGSSEVYQLSTYDPSKSMSDPQAPRPVGRILFDEEASLGWINNFIHHGGMIKKTLLSEKFTYQDFCDQYAPEDCIPLLAIKDDGVGKQKQVIMSTADTPFNPTKGWEIIALVHEE